MCAGTSQPTELPLSLLSLSLYSVSLSLTHSLTTESVPQIHAMHLSVNELVSLVTNCLDNIVCTSNTLALPNEHLQHSLYSNTLALPNEHLLAQEQADNGTEMHSVNLWHTSTHSRERERARKEAVLKGWEVPAHTLDYHAAAVLTNTRNRKLSAISLPCQ